MADSESQLIVRDVTKRYGAFTAVDRVTLTVRRNTIHSVIGPNGAGKSTLFACLAGTILPSAGEVMFAGLDVTWASARRRIQAGMARSFQITSLFQGLTVEENFRLAAAAVRPSFASGLFQHPSRDRAVQTVVEDLLELLSLENRRAEPAGSLSHGDQRLVEVGLALAAKPTLILLDEPTAGMGVDDLGRMKTLILALRERCTVVMVEHNMDIVLGISDTISVLSQGRMIAEGNAETIRADAEVRRAYLGSGAHA